MKTILRAEKAEFTCDITGKKLPLGPAASIRLECGYASPYDGDVFEFHLSSEAAEAVIPILRSILVGDRPLAKNRVGSLFPLGRTVEDADDVNKVIAIMEAEERMRKGGLRKPTPPTLVSLLERLGELHRKSNPRVKGAKKTRELPLARSKKSGAKL